MSEEALVMDQEDLTFCLYDWLDVNGLTKLARYAEHDREIFDSILDVSREVAIEHFLPHRRQADLEEPQLIDGKVQLVEAIKPAVDAFAEVGLMSATMDEEDGGFQLPHVVYRAAFMWFQSANLATASYPLLTIAAAHLIREHASQELIDTYLEPMLDGRWYGTMNLSEPGIGSSLGDLKTSAARQEDGTYRITGDKMWISGGDHELAENIVHLVLARTGGPGTKGLSLFIVPKWLGEPGELTQRNDVDLVGLNHKMGWRGTVNTALAYGSGAHAVDGQKGAVGYLIGEEGQGLPYMFLMMNEARLGVGAAAAALATSSYLHARDFAKAHRQGRPLGDKDPAQPQTTIDQHPDVRRMLLSAKAYGQGGTAVVMYAARLLDLAEAADDPEERRAAELLVEVLTPIAKSWTAQWGLEANELAIQVLGGSGYTRDFPLEQFYRDNRLNPIHEGTHGIQGMDLLGRKVNLDGGSGFQALMDRMRATVDAASDTDLASAVRTRVNRLVEVTEQLRALDDRATALTNSSAYLEAMGDVVVAWLFLDQVNALQDRTDEFARGKRLTARYFITHLLPRVDHQFDLLAATDTLLLDLDAALL